MRKLKWPFGRSLIPLCPQECSQISAIFECKYLFQNPQKIDDVKMNKKEKCGNENSKIH